MIDRQSCVCAGDAVASPPLAGAARRGQEPASSAGPAKTGVAQPGGLPIHPSERSDEGRGHEQLREIDVREMSGEVPRRR